MRLGDEDDLPEGVDPENRGPKDSDAEWLVDLAALRADDALVEELAAGLVAHRELPAESRGTEAELVAMLAAWVSEVRPEAATRAGADAVSSAAEHTGAEDAAAGQRPVAAAVLAPPGRHRAAGAYARRLAIAAALVVLGTSGLAVGAANATPGETLWPVSKVFYAERARSVEAAAGVTGHLDHARTALRSGQPDAAAKAIADAAAQLPGVRPAEGHDDLARAQQLLLDALGTAPTEPNRSSSGRGGRPDPDRERTSPAPSESGSSEPEPGNAGVTPSGTDPDQGGGIIASPPAGSYDPAPGVQVPGGGTGALEPGPGTPGEPNAPATGSEPGLADEDQPQQAAPDEAGSQDEGDEPRSAEPESQYGDGSGSDGSGGTADDGDGSAATPFADATESDNGESDDNSTRDGATRTTRATTTGAATTRARPTAGRQLLPQLRRRRQCRSPRATRAATTGPPPGPAAPTTTPTTTLATATTAAPPTRTTAPAGPTATSPTATSPTATSPTATSPTATRPTATEAATAATGQRRPGQRQRPQQQQQPQQHQQPQ